MQSIKSFFKIIRQIQYCERVNTVEKNLPHFQENICNVGDEINEVIKFKAKNCSKVLPFKTSKAAVSVCQFCKKLKIKPKLNKSECKILKLKIDKLNHALPIPLSDFRVDLSLMKCPYNQTYNLRNLIIAFN